MDVMTRHTRPDPDGVTVGVAARLTGTTVRTLHHWDDIGLVSPAHRFPNGYRRYGPDDLARIRRVLVHRAAGSTLDRIRALLDSDTSDSVSELRRQRAELTDRIAQLQNMTAALDRMLDAHERGLLLSAEEQVAIFGDNWDPSWAGRARDRWGDTDQWAEYAERSAHRSPDDWRRIADDVSALENALADAVRRGVEPGSDEANELAERHRASIDRYFTCTHSMHVCLGRMYESDREYAAHYDSVAPGLAVWLRAAIDANARAHGADPSTATWE